MVIDSPCTATSRQMCWPQPPCPAGRSHSGPDLACCRRLGEQGGRRNAWSRRWTPRSLVAPT
eukprot:scaffold17338_cov145-Isochrysis_galbana.AAC.1